MTSAEVDVQPNVVKEKEKKPRVPKGSKPPPSHPTYLQMVTEAIASLKERGGSSHYAISHYIDAKYKTQLPANYKKLLTGQLRKLAKSGKLTKVKGSFKIPVELSKAPKPKAPKTVKTAPGKKPTSAKPKAKKVVAKPKAAAKVPTKAVKAPKVPKKAPVVAVKKVEKPPAKKAKIAGPKKLTAPAKKPAKPVEKKAAAPKAVKKSPKKVVKKTPKKATKK